MSTALLVVLTLVAAGTASATQGHQQVSIIGSPAQLGSVGPIAVSGAADRIYVLDSARGRVQIYDSGGSPRGGFPVDGAAAIAVDPRAGRGDLYIADQAAASVHHYSAAGTKLADIQPGAGSSPFGSPAALAVDPINGDLYVGDGGRVVVFNSSGGRVAESTGQATGGFISVTGLAVDGTHRVSVADGFANNVAQYGMRFTGTPRLLDIPAYPPPGGVASEPATSAPHTYVLTSPDGSNLVARDFNSSGGFVFDFAVPGPAGAPVGIGASSTRVFVADAQASQVRVYAPFVGPTVTTGDVTPGGRAAELTGTVDPGSQPARYRFELATDSTAAPTIFTDYAGVPANAGATSVSANVLGLRPNTTYYVRLVGTNDDGMIMGNQVSFATTDAAVIAGETTVSDVTSQSADVSAPLDSNAQRRPTYYFEYGQSTSYGSQTPTRVPTGSDLTAEARLADLAPNTTYHVRVVSNNGTGGNQSGPDTTFTTGPAGPAIQMAAVSGVSATGASFAGTVDPQGLATTYYFAVQSLDSAFSASTPTTGLTADAGSAPVAASLSGLPPGEHLAMRLVASNANGTASTDPVNFETQPRLADLPTPFAPVFGIGEPYGCATPRLAAYRPVVKTGQVIKLKGTDLGATGKLFFGSTPVRVGDYTSTSVEVRVPGRLKSSTPITVECGHRSNTIQVRTSASLKVDSRAAGKGVAISVRVPSAGRISIRGKYVAGRTASSKRAGTVKVLVSLDSKGRRALLRAKSKLLKSRLSVAFSPSSGAPETARETVVFHRR